MVCRWWSSSFKINIGKGAFLNDINNKCILSKNSDNSQEQVVNECAKTEKLRSKMTKELNDLDNTNQNKTLFSTGPIVKIYKLKKVITKV